MAKKKQLSLDELLEEALVKDEDKPYEVPGNWVWTRLGFISNKLQYGYTESASSEKVGPQFLRITDIQDNNINWANVPFCKISDKEFDKYKVQSGDIVIARTGATTGKSYLISNPPIAVFASYLIRISMTIKVMSSYIWLFMCSPYYWNQITEKKKGSAQPGVNAQKLGELTIPLPSLPEQQRIVAIIESLFEKLDRAKELAQNALDSFENRKSAILHKAFTGDLTRKWREENGVDNPSDFYKLIREQRLGLVKNSREKSEFIQLFSEFELEDNMPENGWIKLKTRLFCDTITCGKTPTGNISTEGDIPFLKVYNIVNNKIDFNYKPQFIDNNTNTGKLKSSMLVPNDVVMNIVGPPLRKIAIIPKDYPLWNMNQAIVRFRTVDYINSKYLYYCLLSDETLASVINETKGVVGQANISITQSRNLEIPIPPIQEQQEIVRILDNLLENEQKAKELCDVIEKIEHMKKSILARAFRGKLGTNNPDEESALELLKEVLKEKL
jgi:type I restriction enzyme S subunit